MSASKVLDLAERQGLLDAKAIGELRKQVAESKFVVTPEAVAKILVDKGQLTAFQARRLVAAALDEAEVEPGGARGGGGGGRGQLARHQDIDDERDDAESQEQRAAAGSHAVSCRGKRTGQSSTKRGRRNPENPYRARDSAVVCGR
jgi:hypothetical protein